MGYIKHNTLDFFSIRIFSLLLWKESGSDLTYHEQWTPSPILFTFYETVWHDKNI